MKKFYSTVTWIETGKRKVDAVALEVNDLIKNFLACFWKQEKKLNFVRWRNVK